MHSTRVRAFLMIPPLSFHKSSPLSWFFSFFLNLFFNHARLMGGSKLVSILLLGPSRSGIRFIVWFNKFIILFWLLRLLYLFVYLIFFFFCASQRIYLLLNIGFEAENRSLTELKLWGTKSSYILFLFYVSFYIF